MKKMILALSVTLFFLTVGTGCTFVKDQVNVTAIFDEMSKVVDQTWIDIEFNKKANEELSKFEKMIEDGNITSDIAKKAQPHLDNALKEAQAYSEANKKIESDIPKLKELAARFNDVEIKKLADQFVTDFEKSTKLDIQFSAVQVQYIEANGKWLKSLGKDDKDVNDIVDKYDNLSDQSEAGVDQFNKSWEEFSIKMTGEKLKEEPK
ncbi:hypothetical protein [Thermoactinomyces sp. DSM 45892]|uniref:hypothetical protein n=1 Tax=Thermoactinomyces sp. DSM 45892 TaxID=1882753 RepID=UPI00089AB29D|nr:hypothetical protein [Thermoactinomyces sp. DSM 45892]SDY48206.1 hypothetical protein SAMN05444416_10556 [Thermoactinomyces sp. DSM 45892]